jgi:hypothetical protein
LNKIDLNAVRQLVANWVDDLANQNYTAACKKIKNPQDLQWTPELLETIISNYGSLDERADKTKYVVTKWDESKIDPMDGIQPIFDVVLQQGVGEVVGYVWIDLPLNGLFSDLTAVFNILRSTDERGWELEMGDIRVR